MISLSKWANQSESHSSGRELLVRNQAMGLINACVGFIQEGFNTQPPKGYNPTM